MTSLQFTMLYQIQLTSHKPDASNTRAGLPQQRDKSEGQTYVVD